MTASELIVTITIWGLTGIGLFFSVRAVLRRRAAHRKKHQTPGNRRD